MYMHVYRISYNFKSCIQNLNLHVNHKILITASEVSSSGHEDPLSSLENATLKIRTVFCSSGAVYKKKNHTFVVNSNLNFQMKCESSRSTTNS